MAHDIIRRIFGGGRLKSMGNRRRRGTRRRLPDRLVWVLGSAFVLLALLSGVLIFTAVRGMAASWGGTGLPVFRGSSASTQDETPGAAGAEPIPTLSEIPEPWDGSSRVTVLFMGLDYRDWTTGDGPPRTDSMMLATIDPVAKTAGMLSIPRDLWVEIPGFEHNRINTAYFLGESYNMPGGGPGMAVATVENVIGVPVEYYAVIDFSAFERMIDEIGGIDVYVDEDIKISPIGELSRWLHGGKGYHLNGPRTLAYARARKTEGGDFDRARRQQQVALAIRDRVLGFDILPTIVRKAPSLYNELAQGIITNLSFDQMIRLALLAFEIEPEQIARGVIQPPEMVQFETLPSGAEVLIPIPENIRVLRDEIFTQTSAISPAIQVEDSASGAELESAKISVLNGAGREGLAGETAAYLREQGLNVIEVANADRLDYEKTIVIDYTGNPYTSSFLVELMGLSESQILLQTQPESETDLAVILGADWFVP